MLRPARLATVALVACAAPAAAPVPRAAAPAPAPIEASAKSAPAPSLPTVRVTKEEIAFAGARVTAVSDDALVCEAANACHVPALLTVLDAWKKSHENAPPLLVESAPGASALVFTYVLSSVRLAGFDEVTVKSGDSQFTGHLRLTDPSEMFDCKAASDPLPECKPFDWKEPKQPVTAIVRVHGDAVDLSWMTMRACSKAALPNVSSGPKDALGRLVNEACGRSDPCFDDVYVWIGEGASVADAITTLSTMANAKAVTFRLSKPFSWLKPKNSCL